jgi:hypothetical protein
MLANQIQLNNDQVQMIKMKTWLQVIGMVTKRTLEPSKGTHAIVIPVLQEILELGKSFHVIFFVINF